LIKAQSFIDLLGSNNTSSALGSPVLKLHSGHNSLKKASNDVFMAVQNIIFELQEQGINLIIERIDKEFMYQIQVPNVKQFQGQKHSALKIKLSLSGGQLMVKTGGGFKQFLTWLAEKKVI